MTPFFKHDCDKCTYVGSGSHNGNLVDVYETCDGLSCYTHILRFGADGDYITTRTQHNDVKFSSPTVAGQQRIDDAQCLLNDARQERESLRTRISSLDNTIESLETKLRVWVESSVPGGVSNAR